MKLSLWSLLAQASLLLCLAVAVDAFSGVGVENGNGPTHPMRRPLVPDCCGAIVREERVAVGPGPPSRSWSLLAQAAALLAAAAFQPLEPASAAIGFSTPTATPGQSTATSAAAKAAASSNSAYSLSNDDAFRALPRQRRLATAAREVRDLQDLQDSRLDACADRGSMWEQCFMFGLGQGVDISNGEKWGRTDDQLLSPQGSLEPPPGVSKVPTW